MSQQTEWKPSPAQEEEFKLLDRVQAGESSAFDVLVTRYRPRVLRLATGIFHNTWDAEDAVQGVFVKAFTRLRGFKRRSGFGAWLYRLAYNECLNHLRHLRRGRAAAARYEEAIVTTLPHSPATPEEQLQADRYRDKVLGLLDALPPSMQDVLVCVDLKQEPAQVASRRLKLKSATLRVRRHRALHRLASAFAEAKDTLLRDDYGHWSRVLAAL